MEINEEKQKKVVEEMSKLIQHQGKIVKVLFTEPQTRHALRQYWPDGYVGPLSHVTEWRGIHSQVPNGFRSSNVVISFIGADLGITKITLEESGEVLYENNELFYPPNMDWDKMLTHMNEMRELKYGTDNYNDSEL